MTKQFDRPAAPPHTNTTAAREIKFEDIRVGDRVRRSYPVFETIQSIEGVVTQRRHADNICLGPQHFGIMDGPDVTWELLERRIPEFRPGQVWKWPNEPQRYIVVRGRGARWELVNLDSWTHLNADYLESYGDFLEYVGEAQIGVKS